MHDNLRASKTVKDSKSMVFLIPTVNRRNYSSLAKKRLSLLTQRKLQNSPGSIYKYSFITFRLEVIIKLLVMHVISAEYGGHVTKGGNSTGGDNSNKRCLSTTGRPEILYHPPEFLGYFPSMSRFFSGMSRNIIACFPEKFPRVPIPGKIFKFPEQFWLCPETAFVRVVTPRNFYCLSRWDF